MLTVVEKELFLIFIWAMLEHSTKRMLHWWNNFINSHCIQNISECVCVPFVKWTKEQQVCFLWHLWELSDWLFWPALHWLAFDPIGERLHQQLKGWSVANGLLLIYCPIITGLSGRTGGNERGRDKRTEGFINKRSEEEREAANCLKTDEKQELKSLPAPFLMLILSEMAGVPGPRLVWSILTGCVACLKIRL